MISQAIPHNGRKRLTRKPYGAHPVERWDLGVCRGTARSALHPRIASASGTLRGRESGERLVRETLAQDSKMVTGGDAEALPGGPARHVPVLGRAGIELLGPRTGGIYIDGTFGAGGYSRMILEAAGDMQVIAIDRDQSAVAASADLVMAANGRLTVVEDRFSALDRVAEKFGHEQVDGVVLDIGVSSMQLDQAGRGFSFRLEGPLDMRMGTEGPSAADVVARASERDLADIIFQLGEERHSRAVARAIVAARQVSPITTTTALAQIVERVVHARPGQIHPATRTFQALRLFINEELNELAGALAAAERILKPGGRLAVVSFHSLEDRIVKTFLAERSRTAGVSRHLPDVEAPAPTFALLTKRPVVPDEAETAANPRARSAKLRAAERSEAPPRDFDAAKFLPRLPSLHDVVRRA
jgi:16S rRNA (cytosine1402-N4)-methyltransferase